MGTNFGLVIRAGSYIQHHRGCAFPSPASLANDPLTGQSLLLSSSSSLAIRPVSGRSTGLLVLLLLRVDNRPRKRSRENPCSQQRLGRTAKEQEERNRRWLASGESSWGGDGSPDGTAHMNQHEPLNQGLCPLPFGSHVGCRGSCFPQPEEEKRITGTGLAHSPSTPHHHRRAAPPHLRPPSCFCCCQTPSHRPRPPRRGKRCCGHSWGGVGPPGSVGPKEEQGQRGREAGTGQLCPSPPSLPFAPQPTCLQLDGDGLHVLQAALVEGVKQVASHDVRLQHVPAVPAQREEGLVQLHRLVWKPQTNKTHGRTV